MLLNNNYKQIIAKLREKGIHLTSKVHSCDNRTQMEAFKAVILLAKQLQTYSQDLLASKKEINILMAGCDWSERFADSEPFYVLNELLSTDIKWNITFIGNELDDAQALNVINLFSMSPASIDRRVTITHKNILLDEAVPNPKESHYDLVILNHAGFESFYESWFATPTIQQIVSSGTPILGASYGTDEIEIDNFYLKAFGLNIENYETNDLIVNHSQINDRDEAMLARVGDVNKDSALKAKESGMMNWGQTIWKMAQHQIDETEAYKRHETINGIKWSLRLVGAAIIEEQEIGDQLPPVLNVSDHMLVEHEGNKFVRFGGQFIWCEDTLDIIDAYTGRVVVDDVDVEFRYLNEATEGTSLYAMIKAASVFLEAQTYIDFDLESFEINDGIRSDELSVEQINDMTQDIEQMARELGLEDMDDLSNLVDQFFNREKRVVTDKDKSLIELLNNGNVDAFLSQSDDVLTDFRNHQGGNLFHIAAKLNNAAIFNKAVELGIDPSERDDDSFNFFDTAAEHNAMDVATHALDSNQITHVLNESNAFGNNGTDTAICRSNIELVKLYARHGGKPCHAIRVSQFEQILQS